MRGQQEEERRCPSDSIPRGTVLGEGPASQLLTTSSKIPKEPYSEINNVNDGLYPDKISSCSKIDR